MKPIAAEFQAETGVKVDLVQKLSADIRTDFVSQVPTGKGPDVVIGAHDWTGEFVTNGVVAPVELGDLASGFNPVSISAFAYDGQQYGTPYAIENIALVRNNKILADTPATTFDDLVTQAQGAGTPFSVLVQQGDGGRPVPPVPAADVLRRPGVRLEPGRLVQHDALAGRPER